MDRGSEDPNEVETNEEGSGDDDSESSDADSSYQDSRSEEESERPKKEKEQDTRFLSSKMKTDCVSFDMAFYPKKDVFAVALISGEVKLYEFAKNEKPKDLIQFEYHKEPCRAIGFTEDGKSLLSVGKDCKVHIIDMDKGALSLALNSAHSDPINTLHIITDTFFATGDDEGTVKLWDSRLGGSVAEFKENKEFISGMALDAEKRHLLCTSGDGTLSIFNVKNRKKVDQSDQMDDELLSLAIVKNGKKVVCGGSEGALHIFSWGQWGDISDRFPDQSYSIDSMCPIEDGLICMGSLDGDVTLVNIQPNRFVTQIGSHNDLTVLKVTKNSDGSMIGSCTEEDIKLWNLEDCLDELDLDEILTSKAPKGKNRKRKLEGNSSGPGFFDDL